MKKSKTSNFVLLFFIFGNLCKPFEKQKNDTMYEIFFEFYYTITSLKKIKGEMFLGTTIEIMIKKYNKFVKKASKDPERYVHLVISDGRAVVRCGTSEVTPISNCSIYIYSDTRFECWKVLNGQVIEKPKNLGIIIKDGETAVVGAGDANDAASYLYYDFEDSIKDATQVLGIIETNKFVLGFLCERESGEIMCFKMPLIQAGEFSSYGFFDELTKLTLKNHKQLKSQIEESEETLHMDDLNHNGFLGWSE